IYLEEAEDLFKKMEESLLLLEKSPDDSEVLVADVFRSMHTLKGSSGMFGSVNVADFVHNLETVYDQVRSGTARLSKEIIDTTFRSLDHLKKIVQDPDLSVASDKEQHELLTKEVIGLLDNLEKPKITVEDIKADEKVTYHVHFKPHKSIFQNGTNPLLLIDELSDLGKTRIYPYFEPEILSENYDPLNSHAGWHIALSKERGEDAINDVFIFVLEDAVIEINEVHASDLLSDRVFAYRLPDNDYRKETFTLGAFNTYIENFLQTKKEEDVPVESKPEEAKETEPAEPVSLSSNKVKKLMGDIKATQTVRVPAKKLDELMNLVSELVTSQASLSLYTEDSDSANLQGITENIEKLTRQLRDTAFGMTLVQTNSLFNRFKRVMRDLSKQLGKDVEFLTEGGETELDKRIIENVSDPLLHLIRNSLDHGIESAEERQKAGKPAKGTIVVRSYYSGAKVFIQIQDDGKGIDPDHILRKAIEKGLVGKNEILTRKEIYDLIFTPGFSMAENVTDISGRGVGMDVVKRNIHDLRGEIIIESEVGVGTAITLGLPLTLSVIDGLLVNVSDTSFVIPLMEVERCYGVKRSDVVNEFNQLATIDEEQIAFVDLRKEFNLTAGLDKEFVNLVIVKNRGAKIAVAVDSIEGEYQAVLKPVGKFFRKQEFISGATILGDGTMALVLDAYKIIQQKDNRSKNLAS
ncbi:MAG: chemotaxis protein CheA, partial [Cyclobacteriaceae bacterium]